MTRARKFSGKTVDEATEIALVELDAELEGVEIKVVNTGRSGILGFGGEPAEIEISLLGDDDSSCNDDFDEPDAVADEAGAEDEPASGRGAGSSDDESRSGRGRRRNRSRGRGRSRNGSGRDRDDRQQTDASSEGSGEDSGRRSESQDEERPGNRSDDRGGRRDGQRSQRSQRSDRPEHPDRTERQEGEERSQPISREKDEEAEQLVSELIDYFLGAMGVVADTYIREDDEDGSMTFEIEGQDAGLLIGRRGETLQALQFLIRMVTNRQLGRKAYVVIDIEDYRERRVQMLRRLARRMAGRVGSSGREDSLEPMSPAERRIVHMALAGYPEVRTESEGEGNQRRVVIFPK
jgi:spoIIIJ-associated protein